MRVESGKIITLWLPNDKIITGEVVEDNITNYLIRWTDHENGKAIFKQRRMFKRHIIAEDVQ